MPLLPVTRSELDQLITWCRDEVNSRGAKGVVVAMSGGADSACVAKLFAQAIGPDRVFGINIPIESSPCAQEDAVRICHWIGIRLIVCPLDQTFQSLVAESGLQESGTLSRLSDKRAAMLRGNIKARLRTTLARAWAEAQGYLFANTCNWAETAIGYETKGGGDADGDLAPLRMFVKEDVWSMLHMLDAPQWIVEKIPSADLEPGQTDESDMGLTYRSLDAFARVFATEGEAGMRAMNADPTLLARFLYLVACSAHKREGMPYFTRVVHVIERVESASCN